MYVLSYIWEKINKAIADIKVDLLLTRGCKKRKRGDTVESATDRPASIPVDCKSLVESAGNVVSQPSHHIFNLGPQRQFLTQIKVSDTAQSILFAIKGDIDSLKYLFNQGLASSRDVSNSWGFSLVNVGTLFPLQPCFLKLLRNAENIVNGCFMIKCAIIKLSSFCSVREHQWMKSKYQDGIK